MPLKMIYSNFMSRIPPAVIFRKTSRHCSHHLCCALRPCQLASPLLDVYFSMKFHQQLSITGVITGRSRTQRGGGGNIPPVFYDMCQHSAKTDAKSWRSSSKCSDNWLLNCVMTNVSMVRVSSSDPRGSPGPLHRGLYNAGVVETDTGGHDYACSCPRYADSDMDTHGASGNWSHVNRANFTAKSS